MPRRRPRVLPLGDAHRRLRVAVLLIGFVLSLFAGRLVQLQGLEASRYASASEKDRTVSVRVPAIRGSILDSSGFALATSLDARNVTADQTVVRDPALTASRLAPVLGLGVPELTQRLTGKRKMVYVAKQVSPETWRAVAELELTGIFSEKTSRRVYPAGSLAANIVGFVGADGRGLGGLEQSLDAQLAGRDGRRRYETGAGGRRIPLGANAEQAPVDGSDVQLTIDRDIQWYAEQQLRAKVKETKSLSGYAIVYDCRNGDILAMATTPGFDPAKAGAAPPSARTNHAVADAYEPGSTGKVITAAAVIEERAAKPGTPITVPNRLRRGGDSFKDFREHGVEKLTYAGTIAKSSNIGTILAAEKLPGGLPTMWKYFDRFGLGHPTGSGLPSENPGSVPHPDTWSATSGYTMAFGQGYSVNALQMVNAYGTICNDGVRITPRIVAGWRAPDGTFTPAPVGKPTRVVSPATAKTVRTMMEGVLGEGGTAPLARIPGYRVGGKTGTANRYDEKVGRYRGYTMSFMGIAPADAPRFVTAVTLQRPGVGVGGGSTAGPVFKDLTSFALEKKRVPPTGSRPPVIKLTTD